MKASSGFDDSAKAVGAPKIVVIDDEKRIADTLALILRLAGYTAEVAYDGASGLATCMELRPRLVISDAGHERY